MKLVIVLLALIALACSFKMEHTCPHDKEVTCIDEVNSAFTAC